MWCCLSSKVSQECTEEYTDTTNVCWKINEGFSVHEEKILTVSNSQRQYKTYFMKANRRCGISDIAEHISFTASAVARFKITQKKYIDYDI